MNSLIYGTYILIFCESLYERGKIHCPKISLMISWKKMHNISDVRNAVSKVREIIWEKFSYISPHSCIYKHFLCNLFFFIIVCITCVRLKCSYLNCMYYSMFYQKNLCMDWLKNKTDNLRINLNFEEGLTNFNLKAAYILMCSWLFSKCEFFAIMASTLNTLGYSRIAIGVHLFYIWILYLATRRFTWKKFKILRR